MLSKWNSWRLIDSTSKRSLKIVKNQHKIIKLTQKSQIKSVINLDSSKVTNKIKVRRLKIKRWIEIKFIQDKK